MKAAQRSLILITVLAISSGLLTACTSEPSQPAVSPVAEAPAEAAPIASSEPTPVEAALPDEVTLAGILTVAKKQYAGYTLSYEVSVVPFSPASAVITDAPQLGTSYVSNATPWSLALTNTTPGDRPLAMTTDNMVFTMAAIYPADSVMCRDATIHGAGCLGGRDELKFGDLGTAVNDLSNPTYALAGSAPSTAGGQLAFGPGAVVAYAYPTDEASSVAASMASPSGFAFVVVEANSGSAFAGSFNESLCTLSSSTGSLSVYSVVAQTGDVSVCG